MRRNLIALVAAMAGVIGLVSLVMVAFGFRPFILTSESMEPLYHKGSLVWVDTRVDVEELEIGDVLAYRAPSGALVLHRLVGEGLLQGDANETVQHVKLSKVNLIGRETFTIPVVGTAIGRILSVRWAVWIVAGVFLLLCCWPRRNENRTD